MVSSCRFPTFLCYFSLVTIKMKRNIILSVEHLTKLFKSGSQTLKVLDDVSFAIEAGSACAIVGPSGSGKTTLIAICAGLERPNEGSVDFDGIALHRAAKKNSRASATSRLALSFKAFSCCPRSRRWKTSWFLRKSAAKTMRAAAPPICSSESVLKGVSTHYPVQLSGGEQQRVAIARAFMNRPKILFADEPTGNLDAETAAQIVRLIFELNATMGTTLMLVTHDREVSQQAGRVITLKGGRLAGDSSLSLAMPWGRRSAPAMLKAWIWRMAWRDARRGLKPLLLATLCVILGVGSVVTAYSFRDNLNSSIRSQSKTLLGADLSIDSREPFARRRRGADRFHRRRTIAPDQFYIDGLLSCDRRVSPGPGARHQRWISVLWRIGNGAGGRGA